MPYYNNLAQFRRTSPDGFVSRFYETPSYGRSLRTVPLAVAAHRRAADGMGDVAIFDHSLRRYPATLLGDAPRGIGPLPELGWCVLHVPALGLLCFAELTPPNNATSTSHPHAHHAYAHTPAG